MITARKKVLRQQIRQMRQQLSKEDITDKSARICQRLLTEEVYQNASCIALYLAFQGEVDLQDFIKQCRLDNKLLYLPVIVPNSNKMMFYSYDANVDLSMNAFGILEPCKKTATPINIPDLDIIITPLVAFDASCHRLGMGKGYYDRALSQSVYGKRPAHIGVAYALQKVDEIPCEPHDCSLDAIITENQIYGSPYAPSR